MTEARREQHDHDFDGAKDPLHAWSRGIRPDPDLTVLNRTYRHRWLSTRASAEPGRYRTSRTPYMRDIMDALAPASPVQRVLFMKATQVGATAAGNCFIGFVMQHAPGPMLAVQLTVELAKRNLRQRIDPLIEESPDLVALMAAEIKADEKAVSTATREAGDSLKTAQRAQITGAGHGRRLANTIRAQRYPRD